MSDRILLTGGTGFLGSAILQAALGAGHEILALVRAEGKSSLPEEVRKLPGTLENVSWDQVKRFRPNVCIHGAWISTPGIYLESPENEKFVDWSMEFLRQARRAGVEYSVVLGTCIEYAPADTPLTEDRSPISPRSLYAKSKVALHERLRNDPITKPMPLAWARIFYPYGRGEHPQRVCTSTANKLLRGDTIELRTPDSVKDYIHGEDVAAAIMCILENRFDGAINVGTGTGVSIWDLANRIAGFVGGQERVKRAPVEARDPYPRVVADANRLRSLGWAPVVPLEQGIRELCESLNREVSA